ncbi:metal-dependent hydrolase [Undibacterium sp. TS12]|uniref:metal-dependent hydrolase n=1 Tax=Undibacterium sp. TS12 TaxID=2908202 RepID=UPI001F4C5AFB|nr:metal-dependent hydrolase [Undibacterium sp. TS12]MCH8620403.1 metal-dependent hydrolase [Undibacterium sp. TS12]
MSSLVAHVAVGMTVYFRSARVSGRPWRGHVGLAVLILLAIMPDFDYFAIWLLHVRFALRFTHSLFFCLMISAMVWLLIRTWRRPDMLPLSLVSLLLASCSHLLLDLLVGRSLPLLWPFANTELALPLAMLPGAAHTGLLSYEFWRNLIVESCILLPVLAAVLLGTYRRLRRKHLPEILLVLPLWAGCIFYGTYLQV